MNISCCSEGDKKKRNTQQQHRKVVYPHFPQRNEKSTMRSSSSKIRINDSVSIS